jgi:hypothetical protein
MVSAGAATIGTSGAAAAGGSARSIARAGTTTLAGTPSGTADIAKPELATPLSGFGAAPATSSASPGAVAPDRSHSGHGSGDTGTGSDNHGGDHSSRLVASFEALNHRAQRTANGGNQFSLEPPDQGLCAGNGFVVETINDVTRVYDTSGKPVTGVQDLNTFFGYPAAINRTTGESGPFVTDPSCYFDQATQRWFMDVLTLDTDPVSGNFRGPNHLDLAVSKTANPSGAWTIYRLPVQDDGTQGTPDHGCSRSADSNGNPAGRGPCLGDYPHLGADANGIYLSTNEYSLFGPEFHGAQIYAFSKRALARGAATLRVTQFDTHGVVGGNSGFTIWPATSPADSGNSDDPSGGGVEYFLSSNAADEAHGDGILVGPRKSTELLPWALTNTASLDSGSPDLTLTHTVLQVSEYSTPPAANQKPGSTPLADCLNQPSCSTRLIGGPDPFAPETEGMLDSNDTRMQQVTFVNGELWGALDTAVNVGGVTKAGIQWFVVNPSIDNGAVTADLAREGSVGLAKNHLTYPAIGVTSSGHGVMAFTVVGDTHYPSAGYATVGANSGVGAIQIAARGAGPQDGFSEYRALSPPGVLRPRWGDYGAAVPVGSSVWIASEYIGQTCTLAQYSATPFGQCGGTRTALGNWDTRISRVRVGG